MSFEHYGIDPRKQPLDIHCSRPVPFIRVPHASASMINQRILLSTNKQTKNYNSSNWNMVNNHHHYSKISSRSLNVVPKTLNTNNMYSIDVDHKMRIFRYEIIENMLLNLNRRPFHVVIEQTLHQLMKASSVVFWANNQPMNLLTSFSLSMSVKYSLDSILTSSFKNKQKISVLTPNEHPSFNMAVDVADSSTIYLPIYVPSSLLNINNSNSKNSNDKEIVGIAQIMRTNEWLPFEIEEDEKSANFFVNKFYEMSHLLVNRDFQLNTNQIANSSTIDQIENILIKTFKAESVEFWIVDNFVNSISKFVNKNLGFVEENNNKFVMHLIKDPQSCFNQNIVDISKIPDFRASLEPSTSLLLSSHQKQMSKFVIILKKKKNAFSHAESILLDNLTPIISSLFIHDDNLNKNNNKTSSSSNNKNHKNSNKNHKNSHKNSNKDNKNDNESNNDKKSNILKNNLDDIKPHNDNDDEESEDFFSKDLALRLKALLEVAEILSGVLDIDVLIPTIMSRACSLLNTERCSLFLVDSEKQELISRFHGGLDRSIRLPMNRGIAGHTATSGETVNIINAYEDPRFDKAVDKATGFQTRTILTVPIYNNRGEIAGVTEMINRKDGIAFDEEDIKMLMAFNVFCGISLDNAKLYQSSLNLTRQLRGFVEMSTALNKTKTVRDVIEEILLNAKEVIHANRATVFLASDSDDLTSFVNIGEEIIHGSYFARMIQNSKMSNIFSKEEIANHLLLSGAKTLNGIDPTKISDGDNNESNIDHSSSTSRRLRSSSKCLSRVSSVLARDSSLFGSAKYEDILKDNDVDADESSIAASSSSAQNSNDNRHKNEKNNGTSPICDFPLISNEGKLLGIMELSCTWKILPEDVKLLECFAVFATVSIEKGELQEMAKFGKIEQDLKSWIKLEERKKTDSIPAKLRIDPSDQTPYTINFDAPTWETNNGFFKVVFAQFYSFDLMNTFKIQNETFFRFLSEISERYKKVPYHNWRHAVDVTEFASYELRVSKMDEKLSKFELLGLLTAAVCHDANHDGFTNVFNEKAETPLGILFKNQSVMETHHCSESISVLSKEENNIFKILVPKEYKRMWTLIINLILITDMAKHFEFLKFANAEMDKGPLDTKNEEHRLIMMKAILKCGDVSNVSRPFELADKWCDVLCEEFFRQGDLEMANGMEYTSPLNDREHLDKPKSQIGFYTFVCLPLFEVAARAMPELVCNVNQIKSNLEVWKKAAAAAAEKEAAEKEAAEKEAAEKEAAKEKQGE